MAESKQSIYIGSNLKRKTKTFMLLFRFYQKKFLSVNWIIQLDLHANTITANITQIGLIKRAAETAGFIEENYSHNDVSI